MSHSEETNPMYTNRLIASTSPYLLQHAHNPVDWQPWDAEAWGMARKLDRPVIVSIGYSSCHWCHVMEKESFEDEATAEIMNRWFVNIKVDREERPDVDMLYMDACQLMTGRGGWPLNVICLPDQRPLYAGTYFPREHWQNILMQLKELWEKDREKALEYAANLEKGLVQMDTAEFAETGVFRRSDLAGMYENMRKRFDPEHGGMQGAPKFPMPNQLIFLLDLHQLTGDAEPLQFVNLTLMKMANGGICDQIRGGFCRYSTDAEWFAPHFEKMLYDNAQLLSVYAKAFSLTDLYQYKEVLRNTTRFCFDELKAPTGGYYAALDADSDGVEGKYYVFSDAELRESLSAEDYAIACYMFGATAEGNWEHGNNILCWPHPLPEVLQKFGMPLPEFGKTFNRIRDTLLHIQAQRNRPGLDDKIICGWNGLMLEGLSNAAMHLHQDHWLAEAEELADWMWKHFQQEGKLWRIHARGNSHIGAFAEDYAAFMGGLIALYEACGNEDYLRNAGKLAETLLTEFYDAEKKIFRFSGIRNEKLIFQRADLTDDVVSSANSMLCIHLQKLGILLGKNEWTETGKKMLGAVRQQVLQHPGWYSNWGRAAQAEAIGLLQIEITGPDATDRLKALRKHVPSWAVIAAAVSDSDLPVFEGKFSAGKNQIFICLGNTCFEPVQETEQALEIIQEVLGF